MPWIESHTVLIRHRKLIELARELRIRRSYAMGHLHALWHTALEQQEDGDLSSWSDELIAEASDFPGDAPQWVRQLHKHGWLNAKILHDWIDYAGLYLTKKYSSGNREKLIEIWSKHNRTYGEVNGKRTDSERKENLPNLTQPYQPNLIKPTDKTIAPASPPAIDYSNWRLPKAKNLGNYSGCYLVNVPVDECEKLLMMRPSQEMRAALEWRIKLKAAEKQGMGSARIC
ncbi:MAG: hypothetical protein KGL39_19915 [Patescibacteria group bacterium]|nr:hypothetical protein [Patescibacteria group bacterium]